MHNDLKEFFAAAVVTLAVRPSLPVYGLLISVDVCCFIYEQYEGVPVHNITAYLSQYSQIIKFNLKAVLSNVKGFM